MKIPNINDLRLRNTQHGSGKNGLNFYVYEDRVGVGVVMEARRESWRHTFIEKWSLNALPWQHFKTLGELQTAAEHLTDSDLLQEGSKYPALGDIEEEGGSGNRCRLCGPGLLSAKTHWVELLLSWQKSWHAPLCDDHVNQYMVNPSGLHLALQQEVEERKRRAVARNQLPNQS